MLIGGIEAGGTKMVCALGDGEGNIIERIVIPTTTPEETLPKMIDFYKKNKPEALGIACFGPIDLCRDSATYGHIMKTPKLAWAGCDVVGAFRSALEIPIGFDTDVNGAALGECTFGAAKGLKDAIYITIGTGVGVGVVTGGRLMHGLVHPEGGHILIPRVSSDPGKSVCPFHDNCLEGLASGPSMKMRWGKPSEELSDNEEAWDLESTYIAEAITNYILSYSPEKIILWGGVMHQASMFAQVRSKVKKMLSGYVNHPIFDGDLADYIVSPGLGENPGIIGAIELGRRALEAY